MLLVFQNEENSAILTMLRRLRKEQSGHSRTNLKRRTVCFSARPPIENNLDVGLPSDRRVFLCPASFPAMLERLPRALLKELSGDVPPRIILFGTPLRP